MLRQVLFIRDRRMFIMLARRFTTVTTPIWANFKFQSSVGLKNMCHYLRNGLFKGFERFRAVIRLNDKHFVEDRSRTVLFEIVETWSSDWRWDSWDGICFYQVVVKVVY